MVHVDETMTGATEVPRFFAGQKSFAGVPGPWTTSATVGAPASQYLRVTFISRPVPTATHEAERRGPIVPDPTFHSKVTNVVSASVGLAVANRDGHDSAEFTPPLSTDCTSAVQAAPIL
jgi:hypothetical protein